jgi:hypothetical protein
MEVAGYLSWQPPLPKPTAKFLNHLKLPYMKTKLYLMLNNNMGRLLQQITNHHNATTLQHLQPIPAYRTSLAAGKVISIGYNKK